MDDAERAARTGFASAFEIRASRLCWLWGFRSTCFRDHFFAGKIEAVEAAVSNWAPRAIASWASYSSR